MGQVWEGSLVRIEQLHTDTQKYRFLTAVSHRNDSECAISIMPLTIADDKGRAVEKKKLTLDHQGRDFNDPSFCCMRNLKAQLAQ